MQTLRPTYQVIRGAKDRRGTRDRSHACDREKRPHFLVVLYVRTQPTRRWGPEVSTTVGGAYPTSDT